MYDGIAVGNFTLMEVCLEAITALFVVNGMARMQSSTSQLWVGQNNVTFNWDTATSAPLPHNNSVPAGVVSVL